MADLYTKVLVDVSFAAGSTATTGSGEDVLALLEPVTHHQAAALLAWDHLAQRHRRVASAGYRADTVDALGDRYFVSDEIALSRSPADPSGSTIYRAIVRLLVARRRAPWGPYPGSRQIE